MTINVRDAIAQDVAEIAAFNCAMALETENKVLDPAIVGPGVTRLVADAGLGRYFVAVDDTGARLGTLAITTEWSDWRNGLFWWIQSVYVLPQARRSGVFSALYSHIESLARGEPDVCGIRLYVERDNERAQRTYTRLGMHETEYRLYEVDFRG